MLRPSQSARESRANTAHLPSSSRSILVLLILATLAGKEDSDLLLGFSALGRMKGQRGVVLVQVFQFQHNPYSGLNVLRVTGVHA